MPTIHLKIKGKVQGVFYRAKTKEKADELLIKGWVRNTTDGNVEAVAQGSEEALRKFTEWCHRGPERAVVKEVVVTPVNDNAFEEFKILR